jgi:hypothetical protein
MIEEDFFLRGNSAEYDEEKFPGSFRRPAGMPGILSSHKVCWGIGWRLFLILWLSTLLKRLKLAHKQLLQIAVHCY